MRSISPARRQHLPRSVKPIISHIPSRMVYVTEVYGQLGICICRKCRAPYDEPMVGMHPYRRFLRQQRRSRKQRRGRA